MLIIHPPLTPPLKGGVYLSTLSPGGLGLGANGSKRRGRGIVYKQTLFIFMVFTQAKACGYLPNPESFRD
jgi:hypothetical protein